MRYSLHLVISAVLLFQRFQLNTANPFPDQSAAPERQIDSIGIDESWAFWVTARREGLSYRDTPQYILARRRHARLTRYLCVSLAALFLGTAAAGVTALLGGKAGQG